MALVSVLPAGAVGPAGSPEGSTTSSRAAAARAPVPTSETSSPAPISFLSGRRDIYAKESSGDDLLQQFLQSGGSWRRPLNKGGALASQPAVVSWGPGRLDVFARGTDNTLKHRSRSTSGRWSAWESLGTGLTSAPTAASWTSGRIDVFARRGSGDDLYQKTRLPGQSSWSAWRNLGGTLTSSPAATSWGPGRIDVVVRGTGNDLLHRAFRAGKWGVWTRLPGNLSAQPAIAAPVVGQLDVFALGAERRLNVKRFVNGSGWTGFTSLGTNTTYTSGPGATAIGDDVLVQARRSNGFVYEKRRTSPTGEFSTLRIVDQYQPFRGLGTWIDAFDYDLDPAASVADMDANGVRTLYLATARFRDRPASSAENFYDEAKMGQWLDAAHAAGIKVVGWYVTGYGDMARDVRRTVAIGDYVSPGGQRFDATGVDIERYRNPGEPETAGEVDHATFNARVVPHLQQVRAESDAVIGSIVPSPFTTEPGNRWEGFPWAGVGANSEVVVPMALWSFRSNFTIEQVHDWVLDQTDRAQALTGRRVHVEGGSNDNPGPQATPITSGRVSAFVDAVIDGGAIGGSHYDYRTTYAENSQTGAPGAPLWDELAPLNGL